MRAFLDCAFDEARQGDVVVMPDGRGIRQKTSFYLRGVLVCVVVVGYPVGSAAYQAYLDSLAAKPVGGAP